MIRPTSTLPPAEVRGQLERLIESLPFRTSKRCSDFLRFVVEESLQGRAGQLKERSVGVAVFDREPDYDTNQNPVVRNTAGQVRKRLAQYYLEPGKDREIRIDLPAGSYVPEIYVPEIAEPGVVQALAAPRPARWGWWAVAWWAVAMFVGLAAILAGFWLRGNNETDMDRFWAPLVKHPGAIVLCVGQGHAYKLAGDLDRVFDDPSLRAAQADRRIPLTDVVPAFDRYVGLTDVRALIRFAGLFARYGKQVELRGGRTTSLADLRGKPSVLIGAFNNSWTLNLTGEQRFYFAEDPANGLEIVKDRLHPDNRQWQVRSEAVAAQIPMDYAIVSRVFNPTTERAVVVAAGIRGGGTTAAGEFLTNPSYLKEALRGAPNNWDRRNVQFVLSIRMFGGNPGPPAVVAAHYW